MFDILLKQGLAATVRMLYCIDIDIVLIYVYYGSRVCFLASFNQTANHSIGKLWGNLWESTNGLHVIFLGEVGLIWAVWNGG